MSRFDPATYPGRCADGPVLVWKGAERSLDVRGAEPRLPGCEAPVLHAPDRRWVLAYGANACPARLIDKGLDRRGALLLPAAASGWVTAWEARRSATGAVPLTLVRAPGRRLQTWVLGLHPDDLDRLDSSEGRGSRYVLGEVGDIAVAARWHLRRALAYGPARETLVLADGDAILTHPEHAQAEAAATLESGGETATAQGLPASVEVGWPPTRLEPLDLFVYGTLQPGEVRWDAIAGLVDVVGSARAKGRLHATPYGWPAALFADDNGTELFGTLLRPRGDGADLYATTDAIEGDLFDRVSIRVTGPEGPGWAAVYTWAGRDVPGEVIAGGRWVAGQ
jgi:gamma-glutamylcyclotransferase (GGCT)/AIG2-like uncharacterized protein YtfP